jgi:hypothetical protein
MIINLPYTEEELVFRMERLEHKFIAETYEEFVELRDTKNWTIKNFGEDSFKFLPYSLTGEAYRGYLLKYFSLCENLEDDLNPDMPHWSISILAEKPRCYESFLYEELIYLKHCFKNIQSKAAWSEGKVYAKIAIDNLDRLIFSKQPFNPTKIKVNSPTNCTNY